jgi:hypothetical protein
VSISDTELFNYKLKSQNSPLDLANHSRDDTATSWLSVDLFIIIDLFHKNRKYVIVVEAEFLSTVNTSEKHTRGREN